MRPNPKNFATFFPNIENIPFSDTEACDILNITSARFSSAAEQGLIHRSVSIHYRGDIFFKFMNLYDIYEYALRRDFFFLNYKCHSEVNELVFSLIDELASIIDNCIYTDTSPQIDHIKVDIETSCMANVEKWSAYWLLGGDSFSFTKCSAIAMHTWNTIFEKAICQMGYNNSGVSLAPRQQSSMVSKMLSH